MKKADFDNLLQGVRELKAARRGELNGKVRIDRIDPASVAAVRVTMGFSQAKFAKQLGISIDTLQNWEQGRRAPTGAAKVLLRIAATNPEVVLQAVA